MKRVVILISSLLCPVTVFCDPPARLWNGFWVTEHKSEVRIVYNEIPEVACANARIEAVFDSVIYAEKQRWYYNKPDLRYYIDVHRKSMTIYTMDMGKFHQEDRLCAFIRQGHIFIVSYHNRYNLIGLFVEKKAKIKVGFVDYKGWTGTDGAYDEWMFARKNGKLNFVGRTVFCPDPPPER